MDLASVVAALASVGVRVSGSTPNNNIQGDSSRACPTGLAGPKPSGTLNDPGQHFQTGRGRGHGGSRGQTRKPTHARPPPQPTRPRMSRTLPGTAKPKTTPQAPPQQDHHEEPPRTTHDTPPPNTRSNRHKPHVSAASPICSDFQTFCPDWLHFGHFLCFGGIAASQLSLRIFPNIFLICRI